VNTHELIGEVSQAGRGIHINQQLATKQVWEGLYVGFGRCNGNERWDER